MSLDTFFSVDVGDTILSSITCTSGINGTSLTSLSYGIAIDLLEEKTERFESRLEEIFQLLEALEQKHCLPDGANEPNSISTPQLNHDTKHTRRPDPPRPTLFQLNRKNTSANDPNEPNISNPQLNHVNPANDHTSLYEYSRSI